MISVQRIKTPAGISLVIVVDERYYKEFQTLISRGSSTWDGISKEMLTFVDTVTLEPEEPRQNHMNMHEQKWATPSDVLVACQHPKDSVTSYKDATEARTIYYCAHCKMTFAFSFDGKPVIINQQ